MEASKAVLDLEKRGANDAHDAGLGGRTASLQSLLAAPSCASRCGRFWALASSSGLRRVNNHKMILATVVVSTKLETKA